MGKITILDKKNVAINTSGLTIIKPPSITFKIDVEVDKKIEKEAAVDKILMKKFAEQAQAILDMTVKMVEDKCKIFEKLFQGMMDNGEKPEVIKKNLDGLNDALKNDFAVAEVAARQGVERVWGELQALRKEWKTFKIKIAVTIIGTLAVLAVSIAALAVSGWTGGASAAFAIIGFIKAGVTLAQEIKKIAIDIEGARTELLGHLKVVEAAAENKGLLGVNEVTAAVFTEFLGIAQPNIKSCSTCYGTLKAKYAQLVVKCHDLSKTAGKIELERDALEKDFMNEVIKRLKEHPTKDKAGQEKKIRAALKEKLAKYDRIIAEKSKEADALYETTKQWAPEIASLGKRVAELEVKDPKGVKIFREALKLGTLALAPLDGNQIATKGFDLGMGIGGAAGGYVYDKVSSGALEGSVFDI
jgi:hypothetical protein